MDQREPPSLFLRKSDLLLLPGVIQPRQARAWLVGWRGARAVLSSVPAPPDQATLSVLTDDVTWLHGFLQELVQTGFPGPEPLPAFGGRSWTVSSGALWEILSYLPGQVIGWADLPSMEEVGALLGRYHRAVRGIQAAGERRTAIPVADVPAILLSPQLASAGVHADCAAILRGLAEALATDLDHAAPLRRRRLVIHGDFTNHNVLASGTPPRPTGVIDFALAHSETPVADISYGLWRSGRPFQEATCVDLSRVQRFLRGYASMVPISADEASLIPVYLRGRGLQMIAKRIRAGYAETVMLPQVQWLNANSSAIAEGCAAAVQ